MLSRQKQKLEAFVKNRTARENTFDTNNGSEGEFSPSKGRRGPQTMRSKGTYVSRHELKILLTEKGEVSETVALI